MNRFYAVPICGHSSPTRGIIIGIPARSEMMVMLDAHSSHNQNDSTLSLLSSKDEWQFLASVGVPKRNRAPLREKSSVSMQDGLAHFFSIA